MRTLTRLLTLALVLAVTGLVVPDSSRASTQVALVKIEHAEAVALDRDTVWILGVGSDARISASVLSELMAKIWPG